LKSTRLTLGSYAGPEWVSLGVGSTERLRVPTGKKTVYALLFTLIIPTLEFAAVNKVAGKSDYCTTNVLHDSEAEEIRFYGVG
jgi:hypothetical protein